jgi:hypothetical protein
MYIKFCSENVKRRKHSADLRVHGRKILSTWILKKYVSRCGLDSTSSCQGPVAGSCEHGNNNSGSIQRQELVDQLSNYEFLKDYDT